MSLYKDNKEKVRLIIDEISSQLRNRESFGRVLVNDRYSMFELMGFLTVVPNYTFMSIEVTEEDLNDPQTVADRFVAAWCKEDNAETVKEFQEFISNGNKFGWD